MWNPEHTNFPFWQLSCISRLKLIGFRRNMYSPCSSPLLIGNKFTLNFISDFGSGLGGGRREEMGASRFLHGISSYLLMFLIGAEFLQVYNFFSFSFFLSFLPPFFSSLSPSLPAFSPLSPSLPAFSPLPFTAADLSSGT